MSYVFVFQKITWFLSGDHESSGHHFEVSMAIRMAWPASTIKLEMVILAKSGRDWSERTRLLAARMPDLSIFTMGLWNAARSADPSQRRAERYWPTWKAVLLWWRAPHCLTMQMFWSVLAFFADSTDDAETASASRGKISVEAPSTSWIAWISRAANPFSTQTTTVTKLWTMPQKGRVLMRCAHARCSQFYFACLGFRRAADARRAGQAAEVSKEGRRQA